MGCPNDMLTGVRCWPFFLSHLIFTFVEIIHGSAFECYDICFTVTNGTHTQTHIHAPSPYQKQKRKINKENKKARQCGLQSLCAIFWYGIA